VDVTSPLFKRHHRHFRLSRLPPFRHFDQVTLRGTCIIPSLPLAIPCRASLFFVRHLSMFACYSPTSRVDVVTTRFRFLLSPFCMCTLSPSPPVLPSPLLPIRCPSLDFVALFFDSTRAGCRRGVCLSSCLIDQLDFEFRHPSLPPSISWLFFGLGVARRLDAPYVSLSNSILSSALRPVGLRNNVVLDIPIPPLYYYLVLGLQTHRPSSSLPPFHIVFLF
jgi:hypothetical protein